MAPIYTKVSGVWQTVHTVWRKSGGVWSEVDVAYVKVSGVWRALHPQIFVTSDFNLHTNNTTARGIYVDSTYIYVLDRTGRRVYRYNTSDGSYVNNSLILSSNIPASSMGLAGDGTNLFILTDPPGGNNARELRQYNKSTGALTSGPHTLPVSRNENGAMTVVGSQVWMAGETTGDDVRLYKYNFSGVTQSTTNWEDEYNSPPRGVARDTDHNVLYAVDNNNIHLHSSSGGTQTTEDYRDLDSGNNNNRGAAYFLNHIYTVDEVDNRVYVYSV